MIFKNFIRKILAHTEVLKISPKLDYELTSCFSTDGFHVCITFLPNFKIKNFIRLLTCKSKLL